MLALRRNLASPAQTLVLDGDELENLSVAVDGQKVPFSVAANTLTIADVPDAFHAVRRFRARTLADLATGKRHR
jgi:aminopeptidase N